MSFVHGPLSQGHEIRILGTLEDEGSREVCAWIIYSSPIPFAAGNPIRVHTRFPAANVIGDLYKRLKTGRPKAAPSGFPRLK